MKKVCGILVGAGTTGMYVGLGFQPDEVVLKTIDQATMNELHWNRQMMRAATHPEGILLQGPSDTDFDRTVLTDGLGVVLYGGGDLIATSSANKVAHVSNPALEALFGSDQRSAGTLGTVNKWIADAAAAGHFNVGVNTTYVGVGSRVVIRPAKGQVREYGIVAISNDGDAASEATLSDVPVDGDVVFISYKYDFANLPAGNVMPAGILINETSAFNSAGKKFLIEAIQW